MIKQAKKAARKLKEKLNQEKGIMQANDTHRISNNRKHSCFISDLVEDIPLLTWAYQNTEGKEKSSFENIIRSHLKNVAKWGIRKNKENEKQGVKYSVYPSIILMEDGSMIADIVGYDEAGYKDQKIKNKASVAESQASAIYAFALAGKTFKDEGYLKVARVLANFFIKHLPTSNNIKRGKVSSIPYVPFYDMINKGIPNIDSNAGAIGALALYELSEAETISSKRKLYRKTSKKMFDSLTKNCLVTDENNLGLIDKVCPNLIFSETYQSMMPADWAYTRLLSIFSKGDNNVKK